MKEPLEDDASQFSLRMESLISGPHPSGRPPTQKYTGMKILDLVLFFKEDIKFMVREWSEEGKHWKENKYGQNTSYRILNEL